MKKLAVLLLVICVITGCAKEDVAVDGDTLAVAIDVLEPGEVVCVGSFDLEGKTLYFDVSAETGSKLFIGLHRSDDLYEGAGVTWDLQIVGWVLPFTGDERKVHASNGIQQHQGLYYVYVGCESDGEALANITGTVTYQD